ncbi:hypothetical protein [Sinomonas sp. P10A9]|uniref:PAS domain-containing protein n=1 Tax=Sinomonas puerhi TaxID=3238584 RepID=A0AB39L0Z4_9MICC
MREAARVTVASAALPRYRRAPSRQQRAAAVLEQLVLMVDPRVLREARRLARGDLSVIVLNLDGSVTVANSTAHRLIILERRRRPEG